MRSWASRGARSPGSVRNRSSCSRSEVRLRRIAPVPVTISDVSGRHKRLTPQHAVWPATRSRCRVGGRGFGAAVGLRLQILQRVDDTSAELSIGGTGTVGPVFLQRAASEAEESRSFGRAQVSRRQSGVRIGHLRGSVISWSAGEIGGASTVTMAERTREGGCR
jgi:hypothetical protein